RHPRKAVLDGDLFLYRSRGEGMGYRHLRRPKEMDRPHFGGIQQRGYLRPGPQYLARLRAPPDRGRAPPDGNQLRPAKLARPRPACISGPADHPGVGVTRFMYDLRAAGGHSAQADRGFTTKSFYGAKGGAEHFIRVVVPSDLDLNMQIGF